ncbi:MAG: S1-like domain-containing RNA-binding protein [Pseudomonadota bacterium]
MAELGRYNTLKVQELAPHGAYLDDEDGGQILLPTRQVPEGTEIGDDIKVFVYLDSEDRWIATCQRPRVQLHQVASLEVVDVNRTGAFLDWGLAKDLFVPFAEQKQRMEQGKSYLVYVLLDNTGRLIGSTRLNRYIHDEAKSNWPGAPDPYKVGDQARLLISHRTELGYKAVVDDEFWGVIHHDDIRKAIRPGQKLEGYIKRVRDDHRLDLALEPIGHAKISPLAGRILKKLQDGDGTLGLSDKSPADLIELHFGVSKRVFKMAIGQLFKERKIVIEADHIRLANDQDAKKPRPGKQTRASQTSESGKNSQPTAATRGKPAANTEAANTAAEGKKNAQTVCK